MSRIRNNIARANSRKRQIQNDEIDNKNKHFYSRLISIEEESFKKQARIRLSSARGRNSTQREIAQLIKMTSPSSASMLARNPQNNIDVNQYKDDTRAKSGLDMSHILEEPELDKTGII